MARYGKWQPLASNWASQPRMAKYDLLLFHTMVGSLWGTDGYFRRDGYGGAESHWGVGFDGECLQWQDTAYRAEANGAANSRALSVETADIGPGFAKWNTSDGNAVPAWTPAQIDRLVDLTVWACRTHNIPCVLVPDSHSYRRGIGYHRLGVPGYAVSGAELWSNARGKVCPGNRRIAQIPGIVFRAAKILEGGKPSPETVVVPKEAVTMRYVNLDNPTGETPDRAAVLTIDSVSNSFVMPAGSSAYLQWGAFFPFGGEKAVARLEWLVANRTGLPSVPYNPSDLKHRGYGAIKLPNNTHSVEVVVRGLPKGGAVGFHIDGIGHA